MTDNDTNLQAQEVIRDLSEAEMRSIGATLLRLHPELEKIADDIDNEVESDDLTSTLPFKDLYWITLFAQAAYLREARRREYLEHGEGAEPQ
jgi:hypothetical protein